MSSIASGGEWHAKTLRAWQLALLRFAVTLDNADRLAVLAVAAEMDRLHPARDGKPAFGFFRRTSAELCAAILQPNEHSSTLLREFLARMDENAQTCVRGSHRRNRRWRLPTNRSGATQVYGEHRDNQAH
jgi:hypothetical protein